MINPILPTAYLPPVGWFMAFAGTDQVAIEAHENYQKGSWRNRCQIAGPNGVQLLSIPLEKGKHQQTPVRDVRIAYTDAWQKVHWRSIRTAYGNAPFFEHYSDELARFYEKKEVFLFDFNLQLIRFFLKKTGWKGTVDFTSTYQKGNIVAEFKDAVHYPQVFEDKHGFLPGLSMLDALMCCGPGAGALRPQ